MLKTCLRKVFVALWLLLSNPRAFLGVIRDRLLRRATLKSLRAQIQRSGVKPVFCEQAGIQLPFYDDGDLQELLYQMHGVEWSKVERAVLSRHLKPGMTVMDVGANIGFITTIASRLVGETGHVHSFEPSPKVFRKFLRVIQENRLTNVVPHNLGCGSSEGELVLCSPTDSSGNATLTRQDASATEGQRVRIVRLDDYLTGQVERLDFVKIDTEGFEDQVLEGGRKLLSAYKPTIYIELSSEYRQSSQKAIDLLLELGYAFDVEPDLSAAHNGDNFIVIHPSRQ